QSSGARRFPLCTPVPPVVGISAKTKRHSFRRAVSSLLSKLHFCNLTSDLCNLTPAAPAAPHPRSPPSLLLLSPAPNSAPVSQARTASSRPATPFPDLPPPSAKPAVAPAASLPQPASSDKPGPAPGPHSSPPPGPPSSPLLA